MTSLVPFYHFTPEDQTAYELQTYRKINPDGFVQPSPHLNNYDRRILQLEKSSIKSLQSIFYKNLISEGRCRLIPLDIETSMHEVAQRIFRVGQENFKQGLKIIFDGGGIWRSIEPTIDRILRHWCSDLSPTQLEKLITPLFRLMLKEMEPNDYDWILLSPSNLTDQEKLKQNKELIEEGIVDLFAEKFKTKSINPYLLELELAKYKHRVAKNTDSYIGQVFKEHPQIKASQDNLHHIFIKAFGFSAAADIINQQQHVCFSLRTIADRNTAHDCLFPTRTKQTTTPINSLLLNVTPLVQDNQQQDICLESSLQRSQGLIAVIQAISDRNLAIFTFDDAKPADRTDFARTISAWTFKGRCYQKGWIDKVECALKKEVRSQQKPLSQVLANQLIERLKRHHSNLPTILIALTFNASALLLWKDACYKEEIQKLWQLIFNYINSLGTYSHLYSHPLIDCIQNMGRDPYFDFEDLYAQMQVSASIDQHRLSLVPEEKHLCHPTQTCGYLFTQIELPFFSQPNKKTPPFFTLLFPYDLPRALAHLEKRQDCCSNVLRIHHEMMRGKNVLFGFEQSPLKEYAHDPRRQLSLCMENIIHLLDQRQEDTWLIGYLLALSTLALKQDQEFLNKVLKSFFDMLFDQWASVRYKEKVLDIFQKTLENSQWTLDGSVLDKVMVWKPSLDQTQLSQLPVDICIELITTLMAMHNDPFIDIAFKYLDEIEEYLKDKAQHELYKNLLIFASTPSQGEQIHLRPLRDLIIRIGKHSTLPPTIKWNWLMSLYDYPKIIVIPELEDELFENLLKTLEIMEQLPAKFREHTRASQIILKILQSNMRSQQPFKVLSFVREVFRLKLLEEMDLFVQCWDQMIALSPEAIKLAYVYQENCREMAHQFGYWEKLDQARRDHFNSTFTKTCFTESEDLDHAHLMSKLDVTFAPTEYTAQMHQTLHTFLQRKLKDWQAQGIPTADQKMVFALVEHLAKLGHNCSEDILRQTLTEIAKLDMNHQTIELRRMIANFLRNRVEEDPHQLVTFLFKIANDMQERIIQSSVARSIYSLSLEFILILLIHPNKNKQLLNPSYTEFTHCLLRKENYGNDLNFFKRHSDKLLQELNRRELWDEIVQIYIYSSLISQKHSLKNVEILMGASSQLIQSSDHQKISSYHLRTFLEAISIDFTSNKELQMQIKALYNQLFSLSFSCNDYVNAQRWLKNEQQCEGELDLSFYNRAFDLLSSAAENGKIHEVKTFMIHLETPKGYESSWINIFEILLKQQLSSLCVLLIQSKSKLIGIKDHEFKDSWTLFAKNLLHHADQLSTEEDNQLWELQKTIHPLMWHCLPTDKDIWLRYMDLFTHKAVKGTVENIFQRIKEHDILEEFLDTPNQIVCWKWLLKRLAHEGSSAILDMDSWWPKVWQLSQSAQKTDRDELLTYFIQGASKALKSIPSSKAIKQAKVIVARLEKKEMKNHMLAINQPVIFLNFAKICLATKTLSDLQSAIYAIMKGFVLIESDPINEARAVKLTNACLKGMMFYRDQESEAIMAALIHMIQQSPHCQEADQFMILKYWHYVENTEPSPHRYSLPIKVPFSTADDIQKIYDLRLVEKQIALNQIMTNPWKKHVTEEEKQLISKTLVQLSQHYKYGLSLPSLQDGLRKGSLNPYINEELKNKISFLSNQLSRMNGLKEITANIHLVWQILDQSVERYKIQKDHLPKSRFRFLKEEEEILTNCSKSFTWVVMAIASISAIFFFNQNL